MAEALHFEPPADHVFRGKATVQVLEVGGIYRCETSRCEPIERLCRLLDIGDIHLFAIVKNVQGRRRSRGHARVLRRFTSCLASGDNPAVPVRTVQPVSHAVDSQEVPAIGLEIQDAPQTGNAEVEGP